MSTNPSNDNLTAEQSKKYLKERLAEVEVELTEVETKITDSSMHYGYLKGKHPIFQVPNMEYYIEQLRARKNNLLGLKEELEGLIRRGDGRK